MKMTAAIETFVPTMNLRWQRNTETDKHILQQQWRSNLDNYEWRNIPSVPKADRRKNKLTAPAT